MKIRHALLIIMIPVFSIVIVGSSEAQRNIGEDILSIVFVEPAEDTLPGVRNTLVAMTTDRPRIDGEINDDEWERASVSERFFDISTGRQVDEPLTKVRFLHTFNTVFIAVECFEPEGANIASADYAQNNRIEILFDSSHDLATYRGFIVYPDGEWNHVSNEDNGRWNSRAQVEVNIAEDRWTVEIGIPRNDMADPSNCIWGFNVVRRKRNDEQKIWSWNPTFENPSQPENFGKISFEMEPVYIQTANLGAFHAGISRIRVAIGNATTMKVELHAMFAVGDIEGTMQRTPFKFDLEPRQVSWFEFQARAPRDRDTADVIFVLLKPDMETVVTGFTRRGMPIPPLIKLEPPGEPDDENIASGKFRLNIPSRDIRQSRLTFYLRSAEGVHAHIVRRDPPSGEGVFRISSDKMEPGEYTLTVIAEVPRRGTQTDRVTFSIGADD